MLLRLIHVIKGRRCRRNCCYCCCCCFCCCSCPCPCTSLALVCACVRVTVPVLIIKCSCCCCCYCTSDCSFSASRHGAFHWKADLKLQNKHNAWLPIFQYSPCQGGLPSRGHGRVWGFAVDTGVGRVLQPETAITRSICIHIFIITTIITINHSIIYLACLVARC